MSQCKIFQFDDMGIFPTIHFLWPRSGLTHLHVIPRLSTSLRTQSHLKKLVRRFPFGPQLPVHPWSWSSWVPQRYPKWWHANEKHQTFIAGVTRKKNIECGILYRLLRQSQGLMHCLRVLLMITHVFHMWLLENINICILRTRRGIDPNGTYKRASRTRLSSFIQIA